MGNVNLELKLILVFKLLQKEGSKQTEQKHAASGRVLTVSHFHYIINMATIIHDKDIITTSITKFEKTYLMNFSIYLKLCSLCILSLLLVNVLHST